MLCRGRSGPLSGSGNPCYSGEQIANFEKKEDVQGAEGRATSGQREI